MQAKKKREATLIAICVMNWLCFITAQTQRGESAAAKVNFSSHSN